MLTTQEMQKQNRQSQQQQLLPPPASKKPLRLTSELARQTNRLSSSRNFQREEHLFIEWFSSNQNEKATDIITKDHAIFKQDQQLAMIFNILSRNNSKSVTVEALVRKIIENVENLHLKNCESLAELAILTKHQNILTSIYNEIAPTIGTGNNRVSTCFLEIYHIRSKHQKPTNLNMKYKIKYQAKIIREESASQFTQVSNKTYVTSQTHKTIHEQKNRKIWREILPEKVNRLEILVLGKPRSSSQAVSANKPNGSASSAVTSSGVTPQKSENGYQVLLNTEEASADHSNGELPTSRNGQEEYLQLSRISVDFSMILACIHPNQLRSNQVESKVNIQYKDQSNTKRNSQSTDSQDEITSTQFGIVLRLDPDMKVILMERMMDKCSSDIVSYKNAVDDSIHTIDNILLPFSKAIMYNQEKGIQKYSPGNEKQDKHGFSCSTNDCSIF